MIPRFLRPSLHSTSPTPAEVDVVPAATMAIHTDHNSGQITVIWVGPDDTLYRPGNEPTRMDWMPGSPLPRWKCWRRDSGERTIGQPYGVDRSSDGTISIVYWESRSDPETVRLDGPSTLEDHGSMYWRTPDVQVVGRMDT